VVPDPAGPAAADDEVSEAEIDKALEEEAGGGEAEG
jgi:hypothetical protein